MDAGCHGHPVKCPACCMATWEPAIADFNARHAAECLPTHTTTDDEETTR